MESGTVEELGELLWSNRKRMRQCSCVVAATDELAVSAFERAMSTIVDHGDCQLYFRDKHGFEVGNPWPGPTHRVFAFAVNNKDDADRLRRIKFATAVVAVDSNGMSEDALEAISEATSMSDCRVIELKGGRAA